MVYTNARVQMVLVVPGGPYLSGTQHYITIHYNNLIMEPEKYQMLEKFKIAKEFCPPSYSLYLFYLHCCMSVQ